MSEPLRSRDYAPARVRSLVTDILRESEDPIADVTRLLVFLVGSHEKLLPKLSEARLILAAGRARPERGA
jgi:hypothetical protein